MNWKNYKGSHRTTVNAMQDGQALEVIIEFGKVLTGKSRMHSGYYCRTNFGASDERSEAGSMYQAVCAANCRLNELGVSINIYAAQPDFYETGHSAETGWGYVGGVDKPVLMIDEVGVIRDSPGTSDTVIHQQRAAHTKNRKES